MKSRSIKSVLSELDQWGNINSSITFLVKKFCEIFHWSYGEIWFPANDDKFMEWSGYWTEDQNYFEKFSKFSSVHKFGRGIGLIGRTWKQKKPLWIDYIFTDNNFLRTEIAVHSGLNAAVCIPVLNREKVLCVLCFFMDKLTEVDKENAGEIFKHSPEIGESLSRYL
ncbi:MAG: hypothetical protein Kow0098_12560 [Ignavibacteriaceae bacterium]